MHANTTYIIILIEGQKQRFKIHQSTTNIKIRTSGKTRSHNTNRYQYHQSNHQSNPTDKQNIKIKIQIQMQIQNMKKKKKHEESVATFPKRQLKKSFHFDFKRQNIPSDPMKPMQLQEKLKLGRATKEKKSK